jgi:integrating conjugative element protein (TIGR03756 family)
MMKLFKIILVILLSSQAFAVNVATLAEDEVEAVLHDPFGNFLNYKLKGACIWFIPVEPFIRITPYVQHYIPDLVVSVYPALGQNSFEEANDIIDPVLAIIGQAEMSSIMGISGGDGQSSGDGKSNKNKFFEADVIGNPGATVVSGLASLFLLPPATTPYAPYYSSQLDMYLWHNPELEILLHPSSYLPFMNNEGAKLAPWGSLYPRYGMITQPSSFKAAAMIALRATHLAVRTNQAHIYKSAPKNCGQHCNVIKDPDINDNDSVKFQLVSPQTDTQFDPDDFGHDDVFSKDIMKTYKEDIANKGKNSYTWLAWRKYEGCVPSKGTVIAVV